MLINRIFNGNDAVYGLTVNAVDEAVKEHGADKPVGFPHTAYCLPCYYAVTGVKVKTLGELKEALGVVKTLMTRNHELDDALMSGVATALCAEFIEALKYLDGAEPYSEPCYGHLAAAVLWNFYHLSLLHFNDFSIVILLLFFYIFHPKSPPTDTWQKSH